MTYRRAIPLRDFSFGCLWYFDLFGRYSFLAYIKSVSVNFIIDYTYVYDVEIPGRRWQRQLRHQLHTGPQRLSPLPSELWPRPSSSPLPPFENASGLFHTVFLPCHVELEETLLQYYRDAQWHCEALWSCGLNWHLSQVRLIEFFSLYVVAWEFD